ncbi:PRC-barrel domain-containing protein [Hyphomicrobium sp.]|uniref:PRC-barrel domain-containing protein n=1 Tax=Hyphomicrobium sp. TaxID=82 RepID=UPI0025B97CE6|nr:PRC-barrel domain-containing protein [Hyphomicrobium sp.]MCC7252516.1 PRC-barrel domain-containing protein [Hyphomicrobium sp.]
MRTTRGVGVAAVLLFACLPLAVALGQSKGPEIPGASDTPEAQRKAPEVTPGLPGSGITGDWRASRLIGTTMTNVLDESVGKVDDIVIDADGKVVAVMVNVGGFLGLGETSVAIGLRHLVVTQIDADHLEVKTSLSRRAIEQAANLDANYDQPVAP